MIINAKLRLALLVLLAFALGTLWRNVELGPVTVG